MNIDLVLEKIIILTILIVSTIEVEASVNMMDVAVVTRTVISRE